VSRLGTETFGTEMAVPKCPASMLLTVPELLSHWMGGRVVVHIVIDQQ